MDSLSFALISNHMGRTHVWYNFGLFELYGNIWEYVRTWHPDSMRTLPACEKLSIRFMGAWPMFPTRVANMDKASKFTKVVTQPMLALAFTCSSPLQSGFTHMHVHGWHHMSHQLCHLPVADMVDHVPIPVGWGTSVACRHCNMVDYMRECCVSAKEYAVSPTHIAICVNDLN